MAFTQAPPVLSNQFLDDRVLRSYLRRVLPPATLAAIEGDLTDLGEFAVNAGTEAAMSQLPKPICSPNCFAIWIPIGLADVAVIQRADETARLAIPQNIR